MADDTAPQTQPTAPATAKRSVLPKILLAAAVLIVLGVVSLYMLGGSALDSLVLTAVEHAGSSTTGVATTLNKAHINLTSGSATLSGLKIANPPGFKADKFLSLDTIDAGVNPQTITSDVIEVTHIKLSGITVNLEGTPGSMNYNTILDNIKKGSKPDSSSGSSKKFIVRLIELNDVKANVKVGMLPEATVKFSHLEIKNVGNEGLSAAELSQVITQAILEGVASNGGGILPADMLKDLTGTLGSLRDLGIDGLSDLQKGVESTLDDAAKQVGGALDSIFGGSKDKKPGK